MDYEFQGKIDDAFEASDPDWRRAAQKRVRHLAEHYDTFTSEDVITWLERHGYRTRDKRALGSIMQQCARAKMIKAKGYAPAVRPQRHKAPVRVWQSLIKKDLL